MIRRALLSGVAAACVTAAAADNPSAANPTLASNIEIAHCLNVLTKGIARKPAICPGFLVEPLKYALAACRDAGGHLVPVAPATVWTLDVNGDNKKEYSFELEGNVACDGAPSVFSCGSLGCPVTLYENFQGGWRAIGQFSSGGIQSLEFLKARAPGGYRDLRAGCGTGDSCAEFAHYHWTGKQYESQWLEVRGFKVTFGDTAHGLYGLIGDTSLLATPAADGSVLATYGSATEVAVIGVSGAYYYVSPCNACESGFIPRTAVRTIDH
jgi:hypothetical protein